MSKRRYAINAYTPIQRFDYDRSSSSSPLEGGSRGARVGPGKIKGGQGGGPRAKEGGTGVDQILIDLCGVFGQVDPLVE